MTKPANEVPAQRPLVLIEAPYAAKTRLERKRNDAYLVAAMRDSFARGEAPSASSLLYALSGVLDNADPAERELGIEAGLLWGANADLSAVYVDLGITPGMQTGIARAAEEGRRVDMRSIRGWVWPPKEA